MHEMSLCEGIVQTLESEAAKQQFTQVKKVILEIGALSGIEVEALRFCYDVVSRDSLAEGSVLEIITLPGLAWCMQCSTALEISSRYSACPYCGSYQLQVTGGDEMTIKELEVA